jgi:Ca2+-transporting ATPase
MKNWHQLESHEVLHEFSSDAGRGLSAVEARRRLTRYGFNELRAPGSVSAWVLLFAQFKNVLIVILLMAVMLSVFLGHGLEASAIAMIVLFSALLGFAQEYRAERAIEALRAMTAPTAKILREGNETEIPARDVVPGDIFFLRAGDRVPADARLIEVSNLQMEESVLTGESLPVEKHTARIVEADLGIGDRKNVVYSGTVASYGRGTAVAVATGMNTEFGRITEMLHAVRTVKTPLQENLDRVGKVLAKCALVMVILIVAMGISQGRPALDMLIFGIALAVAVVPEALPAVVTISLAMGVQRMIKRHALVRRLPAVETLGSTSVICSDKTGTLTKDEMTVRKIFVNGRLLDVSGSGYDPSGGFYFAGAPIQVFAGLRELLKAAALSSDAKLVAGDGRWNIKGDPTEGALVVAAAKAGLSKADLDVLYPRIQEIPFSSQTKRMTTLHRFPQGTAACAKGAPEVILSACSYLWDERGVVSLDNKIREFMLSVAQQMAADALRVLGIAYKPDASLRDAEEGMIFLGLAGMLDPPRPEAKEAIKMCEAAGIRPVMMTGDHPLTAQAVARELELLKTGQVIIGRTLEAMDDDELDRCVEDIEVYARVSPEHKLRVVNALQKRGHVVAVTGDGVNDAPALKKADIGIAMGLTGTDVSKEAAAMMLADDNFASIVAAVEEGRHIYENIKKYLMYLLSSNIGELGLMAGAAFLGMPLPLTAVQMLYVNLATDGLPALALAVDPPDSQIMKRGPRDPKMGIFTRPVVALMVIGGCWSAFVNLSIFYWALKRGCPIQQAMAMTFVSLVLIQFFKAYNFRSDRRSIWDEPFANKWLNLAVLWELALLFLIVEAPFLQNLFGTARLSWRDLMILVSVSFSVVPVLELAKWMERRGWFGRLTGLAFC